jgi:hypothetical protein
MCNFSTKLICWRDGELLENEALDVQRHVHACAECQILLREYDAASEGFAAYCDAELESKVSRRTSSWVAVLSGGAVAATAAFALFLAFPSSHVQLPAVHSPAVEQRVAQAPFVTRAKVPPATVETPVAGEPIRAVRKRREIEPPQNHSVNWRPAGPAIEIAIPAEAMFPPGAVPDGVNFIAEVSLAPDGSAQRLRLQPQLVRFEGRTTQP